MAMPVNMILAMYVILCILSYDFNKFTMLYIHVHISISMTNKSGLTFFLSIKYLSVCLSGSTLATWPQHSKFEKTSAIIFYGHAHIIRRNKEPKYFYYFFMIVGLIVSL